MKFISQKDKKVFRIIAVSLLILWNLILSAGVIFLHQRINNDIKTSGEINDYGVKRDELLKLAGKNVEDNQVKVPKVL